MSTIITPAPAHQKPSGKLYLGTDQLNLTSGLWTLVELDTISAGFTDGIEDTTNHRITPGLAGLYHVTGQVTFTNVIADRRYSASIRLNGSTYRQILHLQAAMVADISTPVSGHLYLSATDYVELVAMSAAGVNTVDIASLERLTFLSVQRVR